MTYGQAALLNAGLSAFNLWLSTVPGAFPDLSVWISGACAGLALAAAGHWERKRRGEI